MYHFGYGLTYTDFEYSAISVNENSMTYSAIKDGSCIVEKGDFIVFIGANSLTENEICISINTRLIKLF